MSEGRRCRRLPGLCREPQSRPLTRMGECVFAYTSSERMCVKGRRQRRMKNTFSKRRQRHADSVWSGSGPLCVLCVRVCGEKGSSSSVSSSSSSLQTAGHQLRFPQQPLYQAADRQAFVNGVGARETLQRPPSPPTLLLWRRYISALRSETKTKEIRAAGGGGGDSGRRGGCGGRRQLRRIVTPQRRRSS